MKARAKTRVMTERLMKGQETRAKSRVKVFLSLKRHAARITFTRDTNTAKPVMRAEKEL